MRGDLTRTSAADACRELARQGATGLLAIEGPDGPGSVSMVEGRIVAASSPTPRARLGDRLVGASYLDEQDLADALRLQRTGDGHARLGVLLVERGLVSRDAVRLFIQEQLLDALFDVLRWRYGTFEFIPGEATEVLEVPLSIAVDDILVEVARRQQEWEQVSQVIPDLEAVPAFREGASSAAAALEPDEFAVLASVDGERSVRALANDLGYGEFEAARIVYGLCLIGIVEIQLPEDEVGAAFDDAFSVGSPTASDATETATEQRVTDETGEDELRDPDAPGEAGPDEAGPGEAGPDEAGPDEAGPDEAGPDEADSDAAERADPGVRNLTAVLTEFASGRDAAAAGTGAPKRTANEDDGPEPWSNVPDTGDADEPAAAVEADTEAASRSDDAAEVTPEHEFEVDWAELAAELDLGDDEPAAAGVTPAPPDAGPSSGSPAAPPPETAAPTAPAAEGPLPSSASDEPASLASSPTLPPPGGPADEPTPGPGATSPTDAGPQDADQVDEPAAVGDAPAAAGDEPDGEAGPREPEPPAAGGDVSEFLRELSRLALDGDESTKPRTTAPKGPRSNPASREEEKPKKRGLFGWGS